ncbi:TPA: phospholipid carrier-dependent glycosyltransferase [Campylobacter coli]|uniref:phospholipid carrier-dependent glycosyltransferase n=1 Tax=Campylobacter coli TaxID=195 RepID=UPI000576CF4D|nr:phospholipid carrier-dependent glycosyltransferase [Campylobacter coli]EAI3388171.1 phospholipid carrier-dependent glycosyltransferase [Campylobacter jejuni]EAI6361665.1 phospholipid carrier-dependent glycosyltransferase [Campylobacter coli]EAL1122387.1 phospholipid carrier-dependent glycosyltransferase [Campylobacter coli]EGK8183056.1 phospholipid carrier-dependent glycosyltransferase [Campylobacter coli]EKJ5634839.1 phospholipid carrier-dependent glycosyltransferase [Campylobacter coli]
MEKIKNYKLIILLLAFDLLALLYGISTLSISTDEAKIYFEDKGNFLFLNHSLLYYLTHFGTFVFGQNDFGLRIPILFFHFLSCILLYILALKYTKTHFDSLLALLLFVLLPGTVASALLVNEASIVIFLTLAIICAYEYEKKWIFYPLLILALFIDKSFNILFLTFFFFGIYKRNSFLLTLALVLFGLSISFYGFDTGGRPRGYFLDTLGIFAACFSPLVFIYFFYVVYRLTFKEQKSLLWFLMSVTFIFCSLLSLRQKLYLEDFLPFCVICTPLLIKTLMASYRVRLPQFRLRYKIFIECSIIFLLFCYFVIIGNQILYYFVSDPKYNFANNYHLAKELSKELKKQEIFELRVGTSLQPRLRFYGIKDSNTFYLKSIKNKEQLDKNKKNIIIKLGKFEKIYQIQRY